jgi:hypothetical protein
MAVTARIRTPVEFRCGARMTRGVNMAGVDLSAEQRGVAT